MIEAAAAVHDGILLGAACLLIMASARDIAVRLVPNAIPLALALLGMADRWLDGTLPEALGLAALVFTGTFVAWHRRWLGGADVKLLSAGALLVAPAQVPAFLAGTMLAGGAMAVIYLLAHPWVPRPPAPPQPPKLPSKLPARPSGLLRRVLRAEGRRIGRRHSLPYATAISAALLLTMARS